ncbi:hypothetical protein APSETT444_000425 [Aspergillus pseudonomiae]
MQQTPVQRQQLPTSQAPSRPLQTQSHPQQPSQPSHDDVFPSGAQFANRLDDYRNGGQGISGQLGAGTQPQTGNIEEFPPLGRNVAAEIGQDRRGSLMQSAGFGSYNAGLPLSGASQAQATQNRNADLNNAVLSTQRNFTEQQSASGETQETSGAAQSAEQPPLGEMSELDKFGLAGLLRMIHSDSPDVAALAVGQDLMTLGLDLNQPEYAHVY